MRRPAVLPLLAFALPVVATAACWAPTQIVVRIETDLACDAVKSSAVALAVAASPQELVTTSPSAVTSDCTSRGARADLGSLVLVPSDDRSARVFVKVAVGIERPTEQCLGGDASGCIVALRGVSFIEHRSLPLSIHLDRACLGVSCGEGTTCAGGRCVPLDACVEGDCNPASQSDGGSAVDAAPIACAAGRADCDGDPTNGCEADLASSAHCGACKRDCGGATCVAGTCESSVLVGGLDTPSGLAVAGGDVFVGLDHPTSGRVLRCPLAGCTAATPVSTGHSRPYTFATSGNSLYWGDEQKGVFRCRLPACNTPQNVCGEGPQSLVVAGEDVIVASYANAYTGRCTESSAMPMYFALTPGEPLFVAHDGAAVFIAQSSASNTTSGAIDRCPLPAGCGATGSPDPYPISPVKTGFNQPTSLAVDDAFVYWSESGTGNVMRARKTLDQASVLVATGARTRSVVLDTTHVYWIDQGASEADGTIHRANKDGTDHIVLAKQERAPAQLALGPDTEPIRRIFWTTRVSPDGAIRHVAR